MVIFSVLVVLAMWGRWVAGDDCHAKGGDGGA